MNAAGFLRIAQDPDYKEPKRGIPDYSMSPDPLDNTRIHPEDYELARKMATDALERFAADTSPGYDDPPFPYRNAVGEIMWIATHARPDVAYATQVLARYMQSPKLIHWQAVSRLIKYLLHTADMGIHYSQSSDDTAKFPIIYCDADWGRDPADRKSVSGFVVMMAGGPISWKVRRQMVVAKSTAEAEYLSTSHAACEAIWLRNLLYAD